MPYLSKERQDYLFADGHYPETGGDLNFVVTKLCQEFIGNEKRYERYNTVIGALEACKLEFYRRAIAPYEDKKAQDNGDVYGESA